MIRHLRHTELEKQRWDALLERSENRMWYGRSVVLDRVAPGWEALVDEDAGAIMPLTWRSKWGQDYLFQPYAVQQLGVFAARYNDTLGQCFIDAVPARFRYWDIHVNEAMGSLHFDRVEHSTQQVLQVFGDMDRQRAAYSIGHRRNLRKAEVHGHLLRSGIDAADFVALFVRSTAMRHGGIKPQDLAVLSVLVEDVLHRGEGRIIGMVDDGRLLAAVFFVEWGGRSILLKSAVDPVAADRHPMFLLVDHYLSLGAGGNPLLDMAGSNHPGTQRFNAGFGAKSSVYLHLIRNRLPAPLRWLKQLKDGS
jgi:hypothetical protein